MSLSLNAEVLASRYRLDQMIASGGMGTVWRAVDLVLDRPVAVKLLREELAQHPETIARFRAEARHAAGLSHPAIAQVYDFGEASGGKPAFLVMELIDGPPLTALITDGALPPGQVLDIITQVAGGLAVAHVAGVVHRDIKPGNLLIDRAGLVKITDFGVAYAAGSVPLTRTGTLLGTPAYLAPERVAGQAAGPASDLYSLGMVAYECLTGQVPFTGTAMEIALAHRLQSLPPLPASVPPELSKLIADLTARDPAHRPASAGDVAARAGALRDALRAGAIGPATDRTDGSATAMAAAGAAAPDATTEFSATAAWQLAGPDDYDQGTWPAGPGAGFRPRGDARPRRSGFLVAAVIALALVAGLGGWVIANLAGAGSRQAQPPASHSSSPSAHTVTVNAATLTGKPVQYVKRYLQDQGLLVNVSWRTEHGRPGTVLDVSPSGPVPVGTTITITGASSGHHDKRGHDHGHGNDGNGQGGD